MDSILQISVHVSFLAKMEFLQNIRFDSRGFADVFQTLFQIITLDCSKKLSLLQHSWRIEFPYRITIDITVVIQIVIVRSFHQMLVRGQ